MLTVIGNGMGPYRLTDLPVSLDGFDTVVCDRNFTLEGVTHPNVLRLSYKEAKAYILAHAAHENIAYVVTGSPLFYSAGTILARALPHDTVTIIDNTSCKSYLLAKLHIPEEHVGVFSLHGRSRIDNAVLFAKPYTLVLCDASSIQKLQHALSYLSPKDYEVILGYKLGYEDETITPISWEEALRYDLNAPYVILLKRLFTPTSGITPDTQFQTQRGMITKRYKRHLSLQHLDLEPNMILWDIGAGSGSCGIDAYLRYRVRPRFFEIKPERCDHIETNLRTHRICDARLYRGDAMKHIEHLDETPQRIFVGGGGEALLQRLRTLYDKLADQGILLVACVTLTSLQTALETCRREHIDITVEAVNYITYSGKLAMPDPQRQLFLLKAVKP